MTDTDLDAVEARLLQKAQTARGRHRRVAALEYLLFIERRRNGALLEDIALLRETADIRKQRIEGAEIMNITLLRHIVKMEEALRPLGLDLPSIIKPGELTEH